MYSARVEAFFSPLSANDFLHRYYGQLPVHIKGEQNRFSELLTWQSLNRILAQHKLDSLRLRLTQEGKEVPKESFIRTAQKGSEPAVLGFDLAEFHRQLKAGATLILDSAHELHQPISNLARMLEAMLCEPVNANVYGSWHTTPGFNTHWDDHDVIIVQIAGVKHWQIFEPTRIHPLRRDKSLGLKPPDKPYWRGPICPGDLLYIPRGWWHDAVPIGEPTLHVTVGINRATGVDFAHWLVDRLQNSEILRADLPRFCTADERAQYVSLLRGALDAEVGTITLDQYFRDLDSQANMRAGPSFPWSAMPQGLQISSDAWIHWAPPRPVALERIDGNLRFSSHGKRFVLSELAEPVVKLLAEMGCIRFCELCNGCPQAAEAAIQSLTLKLLCAGLITITEGEMS